MYAYVGSSTEQNSTPDNGIRLYYSHVYYEATRGLVARISTAACTQARIVLASLDRSGGGGGVACVASSSHAVPELLESGKSMRAMRTVLSPVAQFGSCGRCW